MLNKYYVGGTYTFELDLTLRTETGIVVPLANQVFLNFVHPNGTTSVVNVTLNNGVYFYTTTVGDLATSGDWAYFWSINTGSIVIPATDPVPFQVRAIP